MGTLAAFASLISPREPPNYLQFYFSKATNNKCLPFCSTDWQKLFWEQVIVVKIGILGEKF